MLFHEQCESSGGISNRQLTLRKCIGDCSCKGWDIADFTNGLNGRCEVAAVVAQNRCPCPDMRQTCRRFDIGSEVIVEAPCADRFPENQRLRSVPRIGDMRHHAVKRREIVGGDGPVTIATSNAYKRPLPVYQHRCRPKDWAMPNTLTLYFRI